MDNAPLWVNGVETIVAGLGRASWQILIPLALVILHEIFHRRVPAVIRCWIYRALFLKIAILLLVPYSLVLPILPAATRTEPIAKSPSIPLTDANRVSTTSKTTTIVNVTTDSTPPMVETFAGSGQSPLNTILFAGWLLGVVVVVARTMAEYRRGDRFARMAKRSYDARVIEILKELAALQRLKSLPEVRVHQSDCGPMLIGIFCPAVIIPAKLLDSTADLRMVLAHELAHCRRHDLLWNGLIWSIRTIFFFHPLLWWAARRYHVSVEIACDQTALQVTGEPKVAYGNLLLRSLEPRSPIYQEAGLTLALAPFTCLKERLMAIRTESNKNLSRASIMVAVTLISALSAPPIGLAQQSSTNNSINHSNQKGASQEGGVTLGVGLTATGASGSGSASAGGAASGGGSTASGDLSSGSSSSTFQGQAPGSGGATAVGAGIKWLNGNGGTTFQTGTTVNGRNWETLTFTNDQTPIGNNPSSDKFVQNSVTKRVSKRSVSVSDGEKLIEISEAPGKVRVRITTTDEATGEEQVKIYAAKSVEELQRKLPEGYAIYKQHVLGDDTEKVGDVSGDSNGNRQMNLERLFQAQLEFQDAIQAQKDAIELRQREFEEMVRKQRDMQDSSPRQTPR